jgi:4'-phosphopantetheinyl transferase
MLEIIQNSLADLLNHDVGLLPNTVIVTQFPLVVGEQQLQELLQLLSVEEQQRSACSNFIVARARLRQILSGYLGCSAVDIEFIYNKHGKPAIKGCPLQFNLAHSGELGVCAVSLSHAVGVDIEKVDRPLNCLAIAKRFFSEWEYSELSVLPELQQREAFFHVWTCKEAFVKATGLGIANNFANFSVSVDPAQSVELSSLVGGEGCSLQVLEIASGYRVALAVCC